MKILQIHNYYQKSGGEDAVVKAEKQLLESHGHEVIGYYRHNEEIETFPMYKKLGLLTSTAWNTNSYLAIKSLLIKHQPSVCHVHNFLPIISPSVSKACKETGVPLVQTLHNYRLICANGLLYRKQSVCEDCVKSSPYKSVLNKCYRNSAIQSFAVARMLERTDWSSYADAYICFNAFMKHKYVEHGLPKEKIHLKPNFISLSKHAEAGQNQGYFIYVGRLDENKGIRLFTEIASRLPLPLKVVGEGDLEDALRNLPNIELLGRLPANETRKQICNASALLFPSLSYEGMPMTILEAFAEKTLVIASNLGAMQAMINHDENGLLFESGNAEMLLKQINVSITQPSKRAAMVENAYQETQSLYSREKNYQTLISIYHSVIHS